MWLFPALANEGLDKLDDFKVLFSKSSDHTSLLDNLKQIGFYTDCLGRANWSIPADVIDRGNAERIILVAKAFAKDPQKYAPQNGGFCTYGMSVGKKFDGNPKYASVSGGKLYVFLNHDIFKLYQKDPQGTIDRAAKNWVKLQHIAASEL